MRADHLVKDLEQFREDLTRHKELWENSFGNSHLDDAEFPIRNVEELRTQCRSLARALGRLCPFLTKFRPSWIMEHPASGVTWDALEEAVSPDALPLRKGPSLEKVLPLIDQVIGQVEAFGSDEEISVDPESPTSIAKRGVPDRIIGLLLRFHLVAQQLRRRHGARATLDIKDEYDAPYVST